MNFRLLAKMVGLLLTLESVAMLACGVFAWFDYVDASHAAVTPMFTAAGLTFIAGILLVIFGMGKYERIPRREGVVIVGMGWLLCAFFGAIPYEVAEPGLPLHAAIFESVSGFTTTGATVITDLDAWPRGILMWRCVTQWLGGLGILVLFVAVLSAVGGGAKSLFRNESSFQTGEATAARIRDTAITLWKIYLVFTVVCILGLHWLGMTWFDAVAHAFTCISTGGFSTHDESIAFFSDWETGLAIEIWLEFFMLLGSVSFLIYVVLLRRNFARVRREEEARWYLGLLVFFSLAIWGVVIAVDRSHPGETLRGVVFTSISIMSSTGYATADYEVWPVGAHFIILGMMLMGGCAGSTAGGMKVGRVMLLTRAAFHEIVRAFRPNQVHRVQMNGNPIDESSRVQTVLFVALFMTMALASMMVVAVLETTNGIDFESVAAAVFSCIANIGPGFGDVGPTDNYAHLRPATQLLLSILMVLGRLELYALLVLFVPGAWRKY